MFDVSDKMLLIYFMWYVICVSDNMLIVLCDIFVTNDFTCQSITPDQTFNIIHSISPISRQIMHSLNVVIHSHRRGYL